MPGRDWPSRSRTAKACCAGYISASIGLTSAPQRRSASSSPSGSSVTRWGRSSIRSSSKRPWHKKNRVDRELHLGGRFMEFVRKGAACALLLAVSQVTTAADQGFYFGVIGGSAKYDFDTPQPFNTFLPP